MQKTFFFYDLETSGLSARDDRIMQFAGQRTNLDLEPIGDPVNILVRLNDDTLPSPEALMVTHITPQQTQADGYSEAEFARMLSEEIFTANTIAVGYNNIRFDDEFIRHLFWRNFYDPYEWAWKDGRSRWDLLDVVRMTRALRPDGIEWPIIDGKQVNTLEAITKQNKIDHYKAHDALSDVIALMDVTRLVKTKQPQLYEYLFKMREKKEVQQLVNLDDKQPFVYVSGRYSSDFHKATIAFPLTAGRYGGVIVYDLRHDPTPFLNLSLKELEKIYYTPWEDRKKEGYQPIPIKELEHNRAPAVAPLGVLAQADGWERIGLDEETIAKHKTILLSNPAFAENIRTLIEKMPPFKSSTDPEARLYDGFLPERDTLAVQKVRQADANTLADLHPDFRDERLEPLLLHYKARNFPTSLAEDEVEQWEQWRAQRLRTQMPKFASSLQKIAAKTTDDTQQFILQELQLWAESIYPAEEA